MIFIVALFILHLVKKGVGLFVNSLIFILDIFKNLCIISPDFHYENLP